MTKKMAKYKNREEKELALAEPVTVVAKITLSRSEWAGAQRAVEMAGVCAAIGLSRVSLSDKILAQVIATGKEVMR